ncbi:MAG: hypothetical protein IKS76_03935 [Paludibacteraceae bacterium]|nr:hypothetical protein [Paludibacteraceae bacterium]
MEQFDSDFGVCPHCGYVFGSPAEEATHLTPGTILHDRYLMGKALGYDGFGVTSITPTTAFRFSALSPKPTAAPPPPLLRS